MAVFPSVMVLYSDDAVEVRYSDGSQLQLSPCGSCMLYNDGPADTRHPLQGGIHKRIQFVTSVHKAKVIQALDFRNRFASRPYLCSALLPAESIMLLYAKIDEITWAKSVKDANIEVLEDGSRRIVSADEYASIVLSPHNQDFTVCYLSRISDCVSSSNDQSSWMRDHESLLDFKRCVGQADYQPQDLGNSEQISKCGYVGETDGPSPVALSQNSAVSTTGTERAEEHVTVTAVVQNDMSTAGTEKATKQVSVSAIMPHDMSTTVTERAEEQVSITAIMQHDMSSISRVSTPDGLRGMIDLDATLNQNDTMQDLSNLQQGQLLHSSPVTDCHSKAMTWNTYASNSFLPVTTSSPFAEVTISNHVQLIATSDHEPVVGMAGHEPVRGMTGDAVGQDSARKFIDGKCQEHEKNQCLLAVEATVEGPMADTGVASVLSLKQTVTSLIKSSGRHPPCLQSIIMQRFENDDQNCDDIGRMGDLKVRHKSIDHNDLVNVNSMRPRLRTGDVDMAKTGDVDMTKTDQQLETAADADRRYGIQQQYTWVTQHISTSQCPAMWRHPVSLLQQVDPSSSLFVSECNLRVSCVIKRGPDTSRGNTVVSPVTSPTPLICPFQHLHVWGSPEHLNQRDGRIIQGCFKVILMEGIIYRFLHVGNMKVVEVYPGDGSILVSQGYTAHLFSHLVCRNGQLEEKIYSLKMVLPNSASVTYSVEKLIKRAHRFLSGLLSVEKQDKPTCWKRAPVQVVAALPVSVLEECTVPGYGRFTAFTNGRVRIVFDDRVALDTVADFSKRILGCFKHSESSGREVCLPVQMSQYDQQLSCHQCRLFLPTGRYINVQLQRPDIYRRYTDAAKEWIAWVQSIPSQRQHFQPQMTAYQSAHLSAEAELNKIKCCNYIVDHLGIQPSKLEALLQRSHNQCPTTASGCSKTETPLQPYMDSRPVSSSTRGQLPSCPDSLSAYADPLFPHHPQGQFVNGFHAVQENLMKTSQMIKDIDNIVKILKHKV